jgi:NADH-quinone oxidoreductase subunit M
MLTIHLSIILFLPLATGLIGAFLPRGLSRWVVLAGSVAVLAYWIAMVFDFPQSGSGLQYVTNDMWIDELGVHYALGVDGLNLFLIGLTAVVWVGATLAACFREWDRPKLFFFHMALAETAVLGAFMAQDLALFVVFFDLMLVPFYFLIGAWGEYKRVYATTKLVIYTLAGSLLMLAGAVALGVLSGTDSGQPVSFLFSDLAQRTLPEGTQNWIFWLFALAFLVKMPAFPFHGWMPDGYRAAPIPVLIVFSGVLSKVGAYGFLRIVLPIMPDASVKFQEVLIIVAVVSILYGSILAFSQDNARLVVGYSSVAQLGFITLGIFSLDPKGAQGALLQMVTHGLVVAPLFFIIYLLSQRARGSELLSNMGGLAVRAPVLAGLFLVVTLATLAMPGSANFVGELLVLFGAFDSKLAYGIVASVGVALAAVYMIRFYQRSMHNPVGNEVSVYPQLVLNRTEDATKKQLEHREVSVIR